MLCDREGEQGLRLRLSAWLATDADLHPAGGPSPGGASLLGRRRPDRFWPLAARTGLAEDFPTDLPRSPRLFRAGEKQMPQPASAHPAHEIAVIQIAAHHVAQLQRVLLDLASMAAHRRFHEVFANGP